MTVVDVVVGEKQIPPDKSRDSRTSLVTSARGDNAGIDETEVRAGLKPGLYN
jgi:hypothetical protein